MAGKVAVHFADGECHEYEIGTTLLDISKKFSGAYKSPIVAAKVNREIKDLQAEINSDCDVEFIELTTEPGMKVYQRSLTFVMITAVNKLFPGSEVTVEHAISKGLYCELYLGRDLTEKDIAALQRCMSELIKCNMPIIRKVVARTEAIELFASNGQMEKVKLLKQLDRDQVSIYNCDKAWDYLYGTMVPSTGYLRQFELRLYAPGFILRFPDKENISAIPPFTEQPKLAQIFREAEKWGEILNCGYVATLNEYIHKETINDIIRVAEALHEKKTAQIADFIAEHKAVKVALIAGPSSSGKTTFAQRLKIQLRVNGLRPIPISLDDYFVDRAHTPQDENGEYDFEAIEAIDLDLFNEHLTRILSGQKVQLPSFNFLTGQREYNGQSIQMTDSDQMLIIEGIHGLNERLTHSVHRENKIKIYISALTQLSIDNHNRIPTTDARLLRRIVRDSQFRGHDALRTLQLWPAVRRGEERNIFPFQEEADIMFNSALIYELAVLKKYAEPLLKKIGPDQPEFSEAKRLLNFLEYFHSIEDKEIPYNSILREFIGNSCFYC